jgi:hypothetical protein
MFLFRTRKMTELFGLLDKLKKNGEFILRDDQYEFNDTLDGVKTAQGLGTRVDLLDTGLFSVQELERLCRAGAHFYSSDDARADESEFRIIGKACAKGGSSAIYLARGPFESDEQQGPPLYPILLALAEDGFILHASNRDYKRDVFRLSELAGKARKSGGFLVYYYHGAADRSLVELASSGAKIHLSDKRLQESDLEIMTAVLKASRAGRSKLVLYVEKGMPFPFLKKVFNMGATLLFKTPPGDPDSPMRQLESRARRRKLRPGTYYLHATFLL